MYVISNNVFDDRSIDILASNYSKIKTKKYNLVFQVKTETSGKAHLILWKM